MKTTLLFLLLVASAQATTITYKLTGSFIQITDDNPWGLAYDPNSWNHTYFVESVLTFDLPQSAARSWSEQASASITANGVTVNLSGLASFNTRAQGPEGSENYGAAWIDLGSLAYCWQVYYPEYAFTGDGADNFLNLAGSGKGDLFYADNGSDGMSTELVSVESPQFARMAMVSQQVPEGGMGVVLALVLAGMAWIRRFTN